MNTRIASVLAACAVALVALVALVAGVAGVAATTPHRSPTPPKADAAGTLSVSGTAQVLVVPDQVELRLGVVSHDPALAGAKADNDRRSAAVLAAIRKLGLEARDVQTDAVHVSPEYRTEGGNPPQLVRYLVQRHVVVTLRDVARFEPLVQAALDAGANEVLNIQFCTTQLRRHRDQARQMAVKAAREKAELVAAGLGVKVGAPTQVAEQSNDHGWSSYSYYGAYGGYYRGGANAYMAQNAVASEPSGTAGPEASNTAFAPGQIRVTAQVAVTFRTE